MREALGSFIERLLDHWVWLMGLFLMVEPLLDYYIESYRTWADKYVLRNLRRRIAWSLSIGAAFVACFLAFQDEYLETRNAINAQKVAEGQRDEARRQLAMRDSGTSIEQQHLIRDPDTLYQYGKEIATIQGAVEDRAHSSVTFQAVRSLGIGDPTQEIEYRDLMLHCDVLAPRKGTIVGRFIGMAIGVECRIIRNRD